MDPTMISVFAVGATLLGVGASLAAIVLTGLRSLRTEIGAVETRLRADLNAVETRLGKRIDDTKTELRAEITAVETRLGKRIDGLDSRVNGLDRRLTLLEGILSAVLRPLRRSGLPDPTPDESPA